MSWFGRLRDGLARSSGNLTTGIRDIFTKRPLDQAMLDELEELLIMADIGATNAADIVAEFSEGRFDKEIDEIQVKAILAQMLAERLQPIEKPLLIDRAHTPQVIVVVGVNGNGKTTTIGKLAQRYQREGYSVMLAAADTFRAAAAEQLQQWGARVGCEVVVGAAESDPASVAFAALEKARAAKVDVLFVDTAGRLHNKANLMDELKKIIRVMQKIDDTAPHQVIQVLDGTTGQNALQQVEAFSGLVDVSGLVVTKLDGTSKAGIVLALAEKFALPVHYIGVGESAEDLQPFRAHEFASSLMGLDVLSE